MGVPNLYANLYNQGECKNCTAGSQQCARKNITWVMYPQCYSGYPNHRCPETSYNSKLIIETNDECGHEKCSRRVTRRHTESIIWLNGEATAIDFIEWSVPLYQQLQQSKQRQLNGISHQTDHDKFSVVWKLK